MKIKSIKDTIHGYIRIETPFWEIVDSAEFQRLKWIEQTSYRVLYPSARHDRFIHSIGVFHLGKKAINGFLKNCESSEHKEIISKNKDSFLLACLLHDIGHAPFSHTCEDLYSYQDKINNINSNLNKELLHIIKKSLPKTEYTTFESDYKYILNPRDKDGICKAPAPHEIMSAIIVAQNISKLNKYFQDAINLDLVIRAILGCPYALTEKDDQDKKNELGIKNCLIRLLNSSTVDVDKLDYIARDTRMSGFDNITIDSERLLDSICVIEQKTGILYPAFMKSALSVIENVVIAKNAQAQWIVQHPVVLYDSYLLRRAVGLAIYELFTQYNSDEKLESFDELLKLIFSSGSLSKSGAYICNHKVSLLSDIEILNWMKQNIQNKYISEYFSRNERNHPIWKSHCEYVHHLAAISDENKAEVRATIIAEYIAPLASYLHDIETLYETKIINKDLLKKIESDDISGKDEIKQIINALLSYKDINGKGKFEFNILEAKSSFSTVLNSKYIYIRFGDKKEYSTYSDLVQNSTDKSTNDNKYMFFYIYSNRKIDTGHFLNFLYQKAKLNTQIRA